jgi:hypothetical protein
VSSNAGPFRIASNVYSAWPESSLVAIIAGAPSNIEARISHVLATSRRDHRSFCKTHRLEGSAAETTAAVHIITHNRLVSYEFDSDSAILVV